MTEPTTSFEAVLGANADTLKYLQDKHDSNLQSPTAAVAEVLSLEDDGVALKNQPELRREVIEGKARKLASIIGQVQQTRLRQNLTRKLYADTSSQNPWIDPDLIQGHVAQSILILEGGAIISLAAITEAAASLLEVN